MNYTELSVEGCAVV